MPERTEAGLDYRCPDCNNDTQTVQVSGGLWVLEVIHDTTCPQHHVRP